MAVPATAALLSEHQCAYWRSDAEAPSTARRYRVRSADFRPLPRPNRQAWGIEKLVAGPNASLLACEEQVSSVINVGIPRFALSTGPTAGQYQCIC